MKKIFVAVVLSVLFVAQTALAMTFSQPIPLGSVGGTPQGGFEIRGASYNNGTSFQNGKLDKQWGKLYEKGIARFGKGDDALYMHYDCSPNRSRSYKDAYSPKFGDKNSTKTVALGAGEGESVFVSLVRSDSGQTFYWLYYSGCVGGTERYVLLAVMPDGKFAKMIDTNSVVESYLGANRHNMRGIYLAEAFFEGDTIIIPYTDFDATLKKRVPVGEFRFKWDDAAQWFSVEQKSISPQNADKVSAKILLNRGEKTYKIGRTRVEFILEHYYNKAIALNSYLDEAYVARGVLYYASPSARLGNRETSRTKALADVNRALEINPNSARAYHLRGKINLYKNAAAALSDFDKAVKLNPNYLDAYEGRADAHMQLKNFDKAIADYTHVIDSPTFEINYMQHYDFDLVSDWSWYINRDQRMAALLNRRGDAYYAKGDKTNALADYKRALKLSPKNSWIGRKLTAEEKRALKE